MQKRTSLVLFLFILLNTLALNAQKKEIVILHTNDTHSQIEPTDPASARNPNEGGVVRRAAAIKQIRKDNKNVLLVDAGDFVQGTPYFNFFNGEVEIKMMNLLGYNVATLGNHEFDNGVDSLANILKLARFPFVSSNYDVAGTALEPYLRKKLVIEIDGVKIGFIGLNVEPYGLISKKNFVGITYLDPVEAANKYAKELRKEGCQYVVAISHIGYFEKGNRGDRYIAANTSGLDLIIGGHSHTNLKGCVEVNDKDGKPVRIVQTMGRSFRLGRVDIEFDEKK
ncbi:MAG: metallophosphoesterase [Bacteroidales bacterium]|nr:metallophosphoesterase [Bacteroidales bacterium]